MPWKKGYVTTISNCKEPFFENFTLCQWIDKSDSFTLMVKCMQVYGHILGSFAVNPAPLAGTTIDYDEKIHIRQ